MALNRLCKIRKPQNQGVYGFLHTRCDSNPQRVFLFCVKMSGVERERRASEAVVRLKRTGVVAWRALQSDSLNPPRETTVSILWSRGFVLLE
jgi:hypothetical protein